MENLNWLAIIAFLVSLYALIAKWQEKPRLRVFLSEKPYAEGSSERAKWRFVHLTVENPAASRFVRWLTYRQSARNTHLELSYATLDGITPKFSFDGRWSGNPEPEQPRVV